MDRGKASVVHSYLQVHGHLQPLGSAGVCGLGADWQFRQMASAHSSLLWNKQEFPSRGASKEASWGGALLCPRKCPSWAVCVTILPLPPQPPAVGSPQQLASRTHRQIHMG